MTPEIRLKNLNEYLEKLEIEQGLKSLASVAEKYDGFNASYISQIRNGKRTFGENAARKLEAVFGLPALYFDKSTSPQANATPVAQDKIRQVPVLNITQAGSWRKYFDEAIADNFEPLVGEYGDFVYGVLLNGDSMLPDFHSGDVVFVDPDIAPNPGDFVIAMCELPEGYATTFKKYRPRGFDQNGKEYFELVSLNEDHENYDSRCVNCSVIATAVRQSKKLR